MKCREGGRGVSTACLVAVDVNADGPREVLGLDVVTGEIFMPSGAEAVREQHVRTVEQLRSRFPKAAAMLEQAAGEFMAFTAFPEAHWRQVWSNDPQERLNREIHDDWAVVHRCMTTRKPVEEERQALKSAPKRHAAWSAQPGRRAVRHLTRRDPLTRLAEPMRSCVTCRVTW